MANAQLGIHEAVKVYIDIDTKRILGMAPASIPAPLLSAPIRWRAELLQHAWEIEAYLAKWREQVKMEASIRTERQARRDAIFRNSLASAIRARNQHVDPWNRDQNNAALERMDAQYDRNLKKQMNPELKGVAESFEANRNSADVALDSPYFKHGPEIVADGDRVDPKEA